MHSFLSGNIVQLDSGRNSGEVEEQLTTPTIRKLPISWNFFNLEHEETHMCTFLISCDYEQLKQICQKFAKLCMQPPPPPPYTEFLPLELDLSHLFMKKNTPQWVVPEKIHTPPPQRKLAIPPLSGHPIQI